MPLLPARRIFLPEKGRSRERGTRLFHDGRVVSTAARRERRRTRGCWAAGIQKVPHPSITVQSGLTALFTHLSTITVDSAAAPPPSPPAHFDVCIFPLWGRTRVASRYLPLPACSRAPVGLLFPRTPVRRSAIVGVGKGFVEGALGAGVCAVRNFYAGDGAVCRGSISEQHPLDFQGFRIDSNFSLAPPPSP